MIYIRVKQLMQKAIRYESRKNRIWFQVSFEKFDAGICTRKDTDKIFVGVEDIYDNSNIMFADMVSYVIGVMHECNHVCQFRRIKKSSGVDDGVKTFVSEYDNEVYYKHMYHHSLLELDAQYNALIDSRKFLHNEYPGYEQDIDTHILYWGRKWFEDPYYPDRQYLDAAKYDNLDDFLCAFEQYKLQHWKRKDVFRYENISACNDVLYRILKQHESIGREHPYDVCFKNTDDLRLQRDAAFLINVANNREIVDLVSVVKDKNQVQLVEQEVMNWYMNFVRLNEKDDIEEQVNKGLGE